MSERMQKPHLLISNGLFRRIPYGQEDGWKQHGLEDIPQQQNCHDCDAGNGEVHDLGCDLEQCPRCAKQLISCDCRK